MASLSPLPVSLDQSLYAAEVERSISKFGPRKVDGEADVVDISVELARASRNGRLWNAFEPQVERKTVRMNRLPTCRFRFAHLS